MAKKPSSQDKFEYVLDVLKEILKWLAVTVVAYIWWTMVLLIFSLILVNVWHILLKDLLKLSALLTLVVSIVYAVHLVKRWRKTTE